MPTLTLPAGSAFPDLITQISPQDTMFDGSTDHYLAVGASALDVINLALGDKKPKNILDLPCGFGRVTRVLRARFPNARITACDLDRRGVDFTAATFNARGAYSVPDFRDLELGERFDLIWVGSLLTHMPEHLTRKFLDFAVRHMGPDSRLVVTSHGKYVAERLRFFSYGLTEPAARGLYAEYLKKGYSYRGYDGGPFYGVSLSTRLWFETLLEGSGLRLQSYHERGWDQHQDVLVLRRAPGKRGVFWRRQFHHRFEDSSCVLPLPSAEQAKQDETVPGFDEKWYCENYKDVEEAKRSGALPSGLFHYCTYGWKEGRAPFDPKYNYA